MAQTVSNLKKVVISIKDSEVTGKDTAAVPQELSFVYGAASEGLTPLETALADKKVGETIQVSIPQQEMHSICGHLLPQLRQLLGLQIMPQLLELDIMVEKVEDASQREIIKAIAASVGSGCGGGSCDCGCS